MPKRRNAQRSGRATTIDSRQAADMREVARAAIQQTIEYDNAELQTLIMPYYMAASELIATMVCIDTLAAQTADPNAASMARRSLIGMDKRLCVAFLEVRQRAIAAAFESDFSALAGHIDIRVSGIQLFVGGVDNGAALRTVIATHSGSMFQALLGVKINIGGRKPGVTAWRRDLARHWRAIEASQPDIGAKQVKAQLVVWLSESHATIHSKQQVESLQHGCAAGKEGDYRRKLLGVL